MQPSSQNLPRGGIYSIRKINRKFDFRSACNKIPKTTAFICILTLSSGIFYMKSLFFCIPIEFTFSKRNLILQSGIYFFNSPLLISADRQYMPSEWSFLQNQPCNDRNNGKDQNSARDGSTCKVTSEHLKPCVSKTFLTCKL